MKSTRLLSLDTRLPEGYEGFKNATDNLGRHHKFMVSPVHCGSILYFNNLTEIHVWAEQVEEVRAFQRGERSKRQIILDHINTGNMNDIVGHRLLDRLSGR